MSLYTHSCFLESNSNFRLFNDLNKCGKFYFKSLFACFLIGEFLCQSTQIIHGIAKEQNNTKTKMKKPLGWVGTFVTPSAKS